MTSASSLHTQRPCCMPALVGAWTVSVGNCGYQGCQCMHQSERTEKCVLSQTMRTREKPCGKGSNDNLCKMCRDINLVIFQEQ
jgi:hypothetical protein